MELDQQTRDFDRVMALNHTTKALLARSFRVNLLALDAMVQSKRSGSSLRGFDEVSSQMRTWSRELHKQLEALRGLSRDVVAAVSARGKDHRSLQLLQRASIASGNDDLVKTLQVRVAEQDVRDSALARQWRMVRDALGDLEQHAMMAIVLSRAAMIEASSGTREQREHLGLVSQEFYRNSEAVGDEVRAVINRVRDGEVS